MLVISSTNHFKSHDAAKATMADRPLATVLKGMGLKPNDLTKTTYLYINDSHQIVACHKSDRQSRPDDESEMIGYICVMGNLKGLKSDLE